MSFLNSLLTELNKERLHAFHDGRNKYKSKLITNKYLVISIEVRKLITCPG